jgi:hypothetical protein
MASSSESVAPSNPPPSLELEIRELKRKLSAQRRFLLRLDGEGGRRFDMMEEDLNQIREDASESLTQSVQVVSDRIADLEVRMERLELQVARMTPHQDAGVKGPSGVGPPNPEHQA